MPQSVMEFKNRGWFSRPGFFLQASQGQEDVCSQAVSKINKLMVEVIKQTKW